ncbi:TonB-dependent receptor [Bacteroidia bacterium]|nr:TonB-dependent receptor [Bacteroidia bacterium]
MVVEIPPFLFTFLIYSKMKKDFFVPIAALAATLSLAQPAFANTAPSGDSIHYQLEEVVIAATRADEKTPIAYTNMEQPTIQQQDFGQDIPYLVSLTPSVVSTSDAGTGIGYTGLRVRGTDANRINITVNGVPLNDAESHGVFWVNMPDFAASLQNIQIQRGVGTSTNGAAAFGATLNMQTEQLAEHPSAQYTGVAGSFGTFKNTVMASTGIVHNKFAMDIRLSNVQSKGYIDRAAVDLKSYYLAAGYYGNKSMLKFITFAGQEKTYQAWNGVPSDLLGTHRTHNPCGQYTDDDGTVHYYDNQTDNYWQQHYQLIYTQQLARQWNFHTALHYTRGYGYYEEYKEDSDFARYLIPTYFDNDNNEVDAADLVRQKWLDNDFYGANFSLNYVQQRLKFTLGGDFNYYDGRHYGYVTWIKNYPMDYPDKQKFYDGTGKKQDYNLFAKCNVEVLRGLNAYADLQYRRIDYRIGGTTDNQDLLNIRRTYNFFNPKAGAFYTFNSRNEVFASFAVAHREPNRNNFVEAGPNEQPTFESLYDYEIGYTFRHERFSANLNGYFMDYKNQLVLTGKISEIGEALTTNIPSSYRTGIELAVNAKIAKWLQWDGNCTLSQNKIRNFTEFVDDWDSGEQRENPLGTTDIAFSAPLIANSIFSFAHKNFSAGWHAAYVGKQFIDNTSSNERSLDAYFVNHLRVGYFVDIQKVRLSLELMVNNLFDHQYESNAWVYSYYYNGERGSDAGYFPQAGRSFLGKLTIKFL